MRLPRGLGAGRCGALILVIGSALVMPGGGALASHHLPDEGATAGKIIIIKPASQTIGLEERVKLQARVCDADGTACKPAKKAKWRVQPKSIVGIGQKRGAVTILEGRAAGTVIATATQGRSKARATITVEPPPDTGTTDVAIEDYRLYVVPEEAILGVGQVLRLTAWGCPMTESGRTGANDVPDGLDDACRPFDIEAVNLDDGSPLTHLGTVGPTAIVRLDVFPADAGGDLLFVGAQISTAIGGTLPSLQARDVPAAVPLFYDMNMDGVVDQQDQDLLSGSLPPDGTPIVSGEPGFDAALDLTADHRIDRSDDQLFTLLVPELPVGDVVADTVTRADLDGDGAVTRADYDAWVDLGRSVSLPSNAAGAPEDVDGDGVIDADDGRAITEVLVRQVEERLGSIPPEGELLGDINRDGRVDSEDQISSLGTFYGGDYDPRLDLDADTDVDTEDWDALVDLIEAHGGDPSRGPAPTPTA